MNEREKRWQAYREDETFRREWAEREKERARSRSLRQRVLEQIAVTAIGLALLALLILLSALAATRAG